MSEIDLGGGAEKMERKGGRRDGAEKVETW